jgi:hypothetical protein
MKMSQCLAMVGLWVGICLGDHQALAQEAVRDVKKPAKLQKNTDGPRSGVSRKGKKQAKPDIDANTTGSSGGDAIVRKNKKQAKYETSASGVGAGWDDGGVGGDGDALGWGGGNLDPRHAQQLILQRLMAAYRRQLAVTNDDEWMVIWECIQKVLAARQESGFGGVGAMLALLDGPGSGGNSSLGGLSASGLSAWLNPANLQESALRRAVHSNASGSRLKAALAEVQESRQAKQAKLEAAQTELREVLSLRQEAIATILGLF